MNATLIIKQLTKNDNKTPLSKCHAKKILVIEDNADIAKLVMVNLRGKNMQVNYAASDPLFHDLMVINPSIELYLLDKEGV